MSLEFLREVPSRIEFDVQRYTLVTQLNMMTECMFASFVFTIQDTSDESS